MSSTNIEIGYLIHREQVYDVEALIILFSNFNKLKCEIKNSLNSIFVWNLNVVKKIE